MFLECIPKLSWWVQWVQNSNKVLHLRHSMQKQSSLSQYIIAGANGPQKLSIPTVKASRKGAFEQVEISYTEDWATDHWRAIESAYLRSPFFIYYNYKLEPVFKKRYASLVDFNLAMLGALHNCLKLENNWQINKETEAYYSELKDVTLQEYPQVFDEKLGFLKDLSIIDLLFNLGPECVSYLQDQRSIS